MHDKKAKDPDAPFAKWRGEKAAPVGKALYETLIVLKPTMGEEERDQELAPLRVLPNWGALPPLLGRSHTRLRSAASCQLAVIEQAAEGGGLAAIKQWDVRSGAPAHKVFPRLWPPTVDSASAVVLAPSTHADQ